MGHEKISSIQVDSKQCMSAVIYKYVPAPIADVHGSSRTLAGHFPVNIKFDTLRSFFADIDIYHLAKKANEILEAKNVIPGFSNKHFFVKSTSGTHQSIQCLANKRIDCDKLCMGFKNREICSHTIAVAIYRDSL